jgi:hypothetical protein
LERHDRYGKASLEDSPASQAAMAPYRRYHQQWLRQRLQTLDLEQVVLVEHPSGRRHGFPNIIPRWHHPKSLYSGRIFYPARNRKHSTSNAQLPNYCWWQCSNVLKSQSSLMGGLRMLCRVERKAQRHEKPLWEKLAEVRAY